MATTTDELRGLHTVRVERAALIERIQTNRDDHRKIYEEAMEGWKKAVTEELERMYQDALKGKDYRLRINLVRPDDHTDEYDSVLELLEMSLDDEFELTYQEFNNFVLDKWGWQNDFLTMSASYGSLSAREKGSL